MQPLTIGPVTLEFLQGDITAQTVDAVVNAANDQLWMGVGVAGAIKARGGAEIEREAMAQGPVPVGEVVVTGAGQLAARHVIHAVVMGQDGRTDGTLIAKATTNALAAATARGLTSLAFPALGTGVGGFPLDRCGEVMAGVVRAHAATATSLRRIAFVLFGKGAYEAFTTGAARALGASS